jgi:hypothetical protein
MTFLLAKFDLALNAVTNLNRAGRAFAIGRLRRRAFPVFDSGGAYVSVPSIVALTHGSHQSMIGTAFRRPKLVGDKALQRLIVGEYLLRPRSVYANGDNIRIVDPRLAKHAVLDHPANRQTVIVGRCHVVHEIGFVTMKQKEVH